MRIIWGELSEKSTGSYIDPVARYARRDYFSEHGVG